jgi:hemolysin activation/secretion protein
VTGFNPNFSKVNFLLLRSQTISQTWSAQFGINGQMTKDTLLSGDTISFGGATVGRGFDNSAIYGDNGLGSYLEIRNDLPITSPWLTKPLQLFAFVDSGTVRNNDNTVSGVSNYSKSIFSKGFGIRTTVSQNTFLELQYARATSLASDTDQRQNPRILFLGTVNF